MEEISSHNNNKRQREEAHEVVVVEEEREDVFKRQKSYKDIITLLEQEEDLPNEDLSSLISTLQEEISFSTSSPSSSEPDRAVDPARSGPTRTEPGNPSEAGSFTGPEEEERESVMRHLLEASDDELGIPNSNNNNNVTDGYDEVVGGGGQVDGGDFFFPTGGEGIWEFEEYEAANYYSMLQHSSEIFM